jgi:hypothetical protein
VQSLLSLLLLLQVLIFFEEMLDALQWLQVLIVFLMLLLLPCTILMV